MLFIPDVEEIRSPSQTASHPLDRTFRDRLEHDASELIFQECDPGAGLDAVFPAELRRNYKLTFRGKCSILDAHGLHSNKK